MWGMDGRAPRKESMSCRILIVEDEATIARNCVTFFELRVIRLISHMTARPPLRG